MDFRIVWTARASADLESIVRFIARRNPTAAAEIGKGILDVVIGLNEHPFSGPILLEGDRGTYRKLTFRRWKIVYSIRDDFVVVMRVWPSAMGDVDFDRPLW